MVSETGFFMTRAMKDNIIRFLAKDIIGKTLFTDEVVLRLSKDNYPAYISRER